jgi:uncharacterized protein (TIGR03437 family)
MSKNTRFLVISAFFFALAAHAAGASLVCMPTAAPAFVRSEGLAEPMGDIVLNCSGGAPGGVVTGNLSVFLSVPVTNRISAAGVADAMLVADNGSGTSSSAGIVPTLVGNGISFNGINFTLSPAGTISFRITNLRGAVAQQGVDNTAPIQAALGYLGGDVLFTQAVVTVGVPSRSLLVGSVAAGIQCYGSPSPETISISGLFAAGTRSATTRLTPGFNGAFQKRGPGADTGSRFVLKYSGFPQGARLFVPEVIAGSDALQPTAGGDLVFSRSGGSYAPTAAGSLLLARVAGADANGAGGAPVYTPGAPGSGAVTFDAAAEIPLVSGAGQVVYEVVDANPLARAVAEVPTFLGIPYQGGNDAPFAQQSVSLAPVSTVARPTETDPIPRFVSVLPPADCPSGSECAALFPKLFVKAPTFEYTAESGGPDKGDWFIVGREGGGVIAYTMSVSYQTGANWVRTRNDPWGNAWIWVSPKDLAPGVYQGTLHIDAGAYAGSADLPVKLTVTAAKPPAPKLDGIAHSATYAPGPVTPGSIAMVKGSNLAGAAVTAAFNGLAAQLFYISAEQINLLVPAELGSLASAQLVVTVDGAASAPLTVALAAVSPGIFPGGVINQDGSVNSASNPAAVGSIVSIYATGLPATPGTITAKIHDREVAAPDYAGPAPTLTGVQQVNLRVPADLPPMTTEVAVCGINAATGQRVCSPPAKITLRQ